MWLHLQSWQKSLTLVVEEAQQLQVEPEVSPLLVVVEEVLLPFALVVEVLPFVQIPSDHS